MIGKLKDKIAIITGSSRGIGKATALLMAQEGAKVVINYVNSKSKALETQKEIMALGTEALVIKCDVSKEEEIKKMMERTYKYFGKVDILVNNAGIAENFPLLERSISQWTKTLKTNLLGVYLCSKYAAKYMLLNGSGKIINIASTSAIYNFCPEIADYDAAKAGVISLTKNFAKSLSPKIQVNAIAPGWVNTDINIGLAKSFLQREVKNIYMKRFAEAEEIAKVCLFLSSQDSNYINGTTIVVDGGHD